MKRAALRVTLFAIAMSLSAAAAAQADPSAAPQPDRSVRDPEFGVIARHYGLERRVEMLQWRQVAAGYAKTWSELPIDSTGFANGYRNPGSFPLQSRRWVAATVLVDGKPLDPAVVRDLGEWRLFRPSFSALPANLAATFQPEGDGLGSAANPLDPHVGDLRIHWRELVLPPLDGRIALRDGRWELAAPPPAAPQADASIGKDAGPDASRHRSWLFGGAFVVLIVALAARRRRQRDSTP